MKILIMNLTRLGDLIQTLCLFNGLKEKYPNAKIDYLALSSFSAILNTFDSVNEIISLDDNLLVENVGHKFWEAYLEIANKIDYCNSKKYDILINPVVSTQTSFIGYLINAPKKLGMFFNENREQTITSEWTAFHLSNEHHLGDRTFNLVDIFARIGETEAKAENFKLKISPKTIQKCQNFWSDKNLNNSKTIGFHIGASQSNKTWEKEKFRELIGRLLTQTDYNILLFGGYKEISLRDYFVEFESFGDRFYNLIGKSNLEELYGFISLLDLIVTNDTGPMHIAATAKCKILNLSLGPVSLWETGPYSENAFIMQANIPCHPCKFSHVCTHLNCHHYITAESVEQFIYYLLGKNRILSENENLFYWKSVKDIFGLNHFLPINKRKILTKELFFEIKRSIWCLTILPKLDHKKDWLNSYIKYLEENYILNSFDFLSIIKDIENLILILKNLLKEFGLLKSIKAKNKKSIDKIHTKWSIIKQIKEMLFDEAQKSPIFYDFFYYAKFKESSLNDEDLNLLIMKTINIYENLYSQLKVLLKLCREYNIDV